jgi:anti-sigma-K factor RskA
VSSREENFDCELSVDAAPYVLGALEDAEGYRKHLAGCARCRSEVAEMQFVADNLPATVAPVRAPAELLDRVLATVRSEAELLQAAGSEIDRPPRQRGRWRSPRVSLLGAGFAIAATAAVAVAIALNVGSTTRPRVTTAQVAPSIHGAYASLRQSGGRAELVVSGMPQPPAGHVYEVWLARTPAAPRPTNALFGVTNSGSASVNVPGSLDGVKEVLVTSEPQGGSLRPTSTPVLRVALHA